MVKDNVSLIHTLRSMTVEEIVKWAIESERYVLSKYPRATTDWSAYAGYKIAVKLSDSHEGLWAGHEKVASGTDYAWIEAAQRLKEEEHGKV